jgi:subtilisin-like proprotein convertase family protein
VTSPGTGSPNKLLYTGSSGPPPPPPVTCVTKTNSTRVDIPDLSTVNSPISVTECAGKKASSSSKISVDIVHTYSGDLIVSIVSPTGTVTTLRSRTGGSTANIVETYTANLSAFDANGTWNLRVQDAAQLDTGYIKSWTLTV